MALKDITKPRRLLKIYHGSPCTNIERFDITKSRKSFLDFGVGIYFTTSEEQAKLWAIKNGNIGAVYEVVIDTSLLNVKQYLNYSNEFINTFCLCRAGAEQDVDDIKGYDSVYGYVVDSDKESIVRSTNNYALGKASESDVRNNIKVFDNKDQICIKTQKLLNQLKFTAVAIAHYNGRFPKNDIRRIDVRWKRIK